MITGNNFQDGNFRGDGSYFQDIITFGDGPLGKEYGIFMIKI